MHKNPFLFLWWQKRMVSPTIVRVNSAVFSILIGCLVFLVVPTLVFQEVEQWTFLESFYFVVITLTTVGFGDFVPGLSWIEDTLNMQRQINADPGRCEY